MLVTINLNTLVESYDDYAEYIRVLKPFFERGEVVFSRGPTETLLTGELRADVDDLFESRERLVELMQVLHMIPNVTVQLRRVETWAVGEPATANLEYDGTNMELFQQATELLMQFPAFMITLRTAELKRAVMPVAEPVALTDGG